MCKDITPDERALALTQWAEARIGRYCDWRAVSTDAGTRRYYRAVPRADPDEAAVDASESRIAVDAPPESQNSIAFVDVAARAARAGLHVPTVIAFDATRGFMLISDLGDQRYLDAFADRDPDPLMNTAIDALIHWQCAMSTDDFRVIDHDMLLGELHLFNEWYIKRHLGRMLTTSEASALESTYELIAGRVGRQHHVLVHRDYIPRNLMVSDPCPGIIDFQDARAGPIAYDVASLCRDAFIDWPDERVRAWQYRYWLGACAAGLPVAAGWAEFQEDLTWAGLQRHLKVLGVFARLCWRDGKPDYIADAPRFIRYLQPVVEADPALAPLRAFMVGAE
ncbi:phosphotransferase [Salinisphaera sp. USBA-960]|uniref:aminoglycoside phosphotransferase family protein n=1 Tax=Salinisphaera orenii TaxID=856731 RepID=UPI0013A617C8|nr:phosphotransferase [Salifodinibacter halophilus]